MHDGVVRDTGEPAFIHNAYRQTYYKAGDGKWVWACAAHCGARIAAHASLYIARAQTIE